MADKPTRQAQAKSGATREDRLKAALKANLARRKAQSRARAEIKEAEPAQTGQDKDA